MDKEVDVIAYGRRACGINYDQRFQLHAGYPCPWHATAVCSCWCWCWWCHCWCSYSYLGTVRKRASKISDFPSFSSRLSDFLEASSRKQYFQNIRKCQLKNHLCWVQRYSSISFITKFMLVGQIGQLDTLAAQAVVGHEDYCRIWWILSTAINVDEYWWISSHDDLSKWWILSIFHNSVCPN